jgi:hypothetical protein
MIGAKSCRPEEVDEALERCGRDRRPAEKQEWIDGR